MNTIPAQNFRSLQKEDRCPSFSLWGSYFNYNSALNYTSISSKDDWSS